jgi:hypothetical protein
MSVTNDKSWFVLEYQHSAKWSVVRDEVPRRVTQTIGTRKVTLTVIWGIDGFHVVDMTPPVGRFNTESFLPHIMDTFLATGFPDGRKNLNVFLSI